MAFQYVNAPNKTEELNGLSTFHPPPPPPRVEVGVKCIWKGHIFQKFGHFLEDTIQFLLCFCVIYTIRHIQLFSVLILT